jgi:hypothetical protein
VDISWESARSQFAVNSIIHQGDSLSLNKDNNWLSYTLGCFSSDILDLAYGDGKLVLCFDTLKFGQPNPVLLLTRMEIPLTDRISVWDGLLIPLLLIILPGEWSGLIMPFILPVGMPD